MKHILIAVILLAISIIVFYFAKRTADKSNLYSLYVPATRLSELASGTPGFYTGRANTSQPLLTPYGKKQCAYFRYVTERYSQTTDANGGTDWQWQTESSGNSGNNPFFIQNENEYVLVYPTDGNIDGLTEETMDLNNEVQGMGTVINAIGHLAGPTRRVREEYFPTGATVSVGGQVFEENNLTVFRHDKTYPLVLTTKTKEMLVESGSTKSKIGYLISLLFAVSAAAAFFFVK